MKTEESKLLWDAQEYLRSLTYIDWHNIRDIPEDISTLVITEIDENYLCDYEYNDDYTAFRKLRFKLSYKDHYLRKKLRSRL